MDIKFEVPATEVHAEPSLQSSKHAKGVTVRVCCELEDLMKALIDEGLRDPIEAYLTNDEIFCLLWRKLNEQKQK